jgi:hypothetical protein
LPDYGSVGASCHVELELTSGLLDDDLAGFHEKAQRAFIACRQVVNDELARQRAGQESPEPTRGSFPGANGTDTNGNSSQRTGSPAHRALGKQVGYIEQLAGEVRGPDARRLQALAQLIFKKPLADLSSLDASLAAG